MNVDDIPHGAPTATGRDYPLYAEEHAIECPYQTRYYAFKKDVFAISHGLQGPVTSTWEVANGTLDFNTLQHLGDAHRFLPAHWDEAKVFMSQNRRANIFYWLRKVWHKLPLLVKSFVFVIVGYFGVYFLNGSCDWGMGKLECAKFQNSANPPCVMMLGVKYYCAKSLAQLFQSFHAEMLTFIVSLMTLSQYI